MAHASFNTLSQDLKRLLLDHIPDLTTLQHLVKADSTMRALFMRAPRSTIEAVVQNYSAPLVESIRDVFRAWFSNRGLRYQHTWIVEGEITSEDEDVDPLTDRPGAIIRGEWSAGPRNDIWGREAGIIEADPMGTLRTMVTIVRHVEDLTDWRPDEKEKAAAKIALRHSPEIIWMVVRFVLNVGNTGASWWSRNGGREACYHDRVARHYLATRSDTELEMFVDGFRKLEQISRSSGWGPDARGSPETRRSRWMFKRMAKLTLDVMNNKTGWHVEW